MHDRNRRRVRDSGGMLQAAAECGRSLAKDMASDLQLGAGYSL